jgi:hypothetical protein
MSFENWLEQHISRFEDIKNDSNYESNKSKIISLLKIAYNDGIKEYIIKSTWKKGEI